MFVLFIYFSARVGCGRRHDCTHDDIRPNANESYSYPTKEGYK